MTTAWNPLVRDGWKRLRELCGPTPTRGEVYAWLHSLVEFGVYNSGKESIALDLAAYGFEPEHMARALGELEQSGDILTAGGSLYLPACLADTCAAPYSRTQIPRIEDLIKGMPAQLLEHWKRDLLDVTARADTERAKRRRGVKESMFERVKTVLGVTLCLVPEPDESSPQLELPFAAPRPEMRIVKTDDLDEHALCMLALIGEENGEDYGAEGRRALAAKTGHTPGPVRVQQDHAAGRTGAGLPARSDPAADHVPPGPSGRTGNAHASAGHLSSGLRAGAAGAAESPLERFVRHSQIDGVARILRSPVIADAEREQLLFDDAVKRTGASQAEQDEMARIAQETFPWWERGIALDALCRPIGWSNKTDRFAELLTKARTPAMKTKARGVLPQPTLSDRDDLDELFGDPQRSAG